MTLLTEKLKYASLMQSSLLTY